jgi:hypothetical protein
MREHIGEALKRYQLARDTFDNESRPNRIISEART